MKTRLNKRLRDLPKEGPSLCCVLRVLLALFRLPFALCALGPTLGIQPHLLLDEPQVP